MTKKPAWNFALKLEGISPADVPMLALSDYIKLWGNLIVAHDTAEIDGVVFKLQGKDKTTSIGLLEDGTNQVFHFETTNTELARQFAQHFKAVILL